MLASADRTFMTASNDDESLVRIERPRARWTATFGLVTAAAMVLSLLGGLFLVTTQALSEPEALALARERPLVTLQIVVGLLLLAALVLVPIRRLATRAGRAGLVEIDNGFVRVRESGLFSTRSFVEPLDTYLGISHRIRTTLSGIEHELVLVHPNVHRDVVIALDGAPPAAAVARMMTRLALPEIAAGDIARARWVAPDVLAGVAGVRT